jgi:nicotinamidase-related amidase
MKARSLRSAGSAPDSFGQRQLDRIRTLIRNSLGFYQTELDATLKKLRIKYLIITGCTTSVCVEAAVRDAMYRDYSRVLLQDCMSQPTLGSSLPGSNHDASLVVAEVFLGWVSNSGQFVNALHVQPIAAVQEQH